VVTANKAAWTQNVRRLDTLRQRSKGLSPKESADIAAESSLVAFLGVPVTGQMRLAENVARLAESCSLAGVRVTILPARDSALARRRTLGGIKPANYSIGVEFLGRFADAQKFVSILPPSVSLWRLTARRHEGGAEYQLVLSVYELDADSSH
jgi:hypothetical protein